MKPNLEKSFECIANQEICLWRIVRDDSDTYRDCHKCTGLNQCQMYQSIKLDEALPKNRYIVR